MFCSDVTVRSITLQARTTLTWAIVGPWRDQILYSVMPILVPSISARETELPRIVHEYAGDAIAALGAPDSSFSDDDRRWVMQGARSLSEIEKAMLRVVALNITHNVSQAARLLGIASVSLSRWLDHRRPLPIRTAGLTP